MISHTIRRKLQKKRKRNKYGKCPKCGSRTRKRLDQIGGIVEECSNYKWIVNSDFTLRCTYIKILDKAFNDDYLSQEEDAEYLIPPQIAGQLIRSLQSGEVLQGTLVIPFGPSRINKADLVDSNG